MPPPPLNADEVLREASRRRTFAIISHPDAGKTTLTEKFLLYSGAVQEAGAVKARRGRRGATSDWMELEQQRGISITSSALQFTYDDHVINLLDTPGHRDFSEDTYRVLAAADTAVMVLDAAKGIETQTLKLFEVCRQRRIPIISFMNKFDRPGLGALELLDQIEDQLGLRATPVTWPVGIAGDFRGVYDRGSGRYVRFTRTTGGSTIAPEEDVEADLAAAEEGSAWTACLEELELLDAIGADVDAKSFLAGDSTPVFFGSALTNFGVRLVLDSLVDLAPAPEPRTQVDGSPRPVDSDFSAFVFKVQANMDKAHRDRIAFLRMCSGRFERGMVVTHGRTGKPFATKYAHQVFAQDRETIDIAYPGDVIGLVNATDVRIGDTLYVGEPAEFPQIPRFAPEMFVTARAVETGRFKQFRRGLAQLDDEGTVQLLTDPSGADPVPMLGAVGQLQFDVARHRLEDEFGVVVELSPTAYTVARRTDPESVDGLRALPGCRVMARSDGVLLALFESVHWLRRVEQDKPELALLPVLDA